jgi:hypothetical protein
MPGIQEQNIAAANYLDLRGEAGVWQGLSGNAARAHQMSQVMGLTVHLMAWRELFA